MPAERRGQVSPRGCSTDRGLIGPAGQAVSPSASRRRRFRREAGEAAAGRSWLRSPLRGTPCLRRPREAGGFGVNALAVRRDAGIAVNRDIGFGDGAHSALVSGRGGEGMWLRHGCLMQRTYATRMPRESAARFRGPRTWAPSSAYGSSPARRH
jgi:hypothetical protein